jgi:hypothetical protein
VSVDRNFDAGLLDESLSTFGGKDKALTWNPPSGLCTSETLPEGVSYKIVKKNRQSVNPGSRLRSSTSFQLH